MGKNKSCFFFLSSCGSELIFCQILNRTNENLKMNKQRNKQTNSNKQTLSEIETGSELETNDSKFCKLLKGFGDTSTGLSINC